ncbi:MAG: DUF4097 family beta strand repeat protein [Calditrichaeota bacterium]|nr:DUF4097 family beta strand repeat protein [Calditrichota bacterium]
MKSSKILTFLTVIFIMLLTVAASQAEVKLKETTVRLFPLAPNGDLSISNINGEIQIEAWDKDSVKVAAEKIIRASSREKAQEYLKAFKIEFEAGNDFLTVKPIFPKHTGEGWNFFDWIFGTGSRVHATINFHLWVPRKSNIESSSVNGSTRIAGATGEIDAKGTNGRIVLNGVSGDISAETVNGSIKARILNGNHLNTLVLKTINGSITAELPGTTGGHIELKTINGSIESDFPIVFTGKISRHKMKGRFGKGHSRVQLTTINGAIHVRKLSEK